MSYGVLVDVVPLFFQQVFCNPAGCKISQLIIGKHYNRDVLGCWVTLLTCVGKIKVQMYFKYF